MNDFQKYFKEQLSAEAIIKGGPGSGHYGHSGRPGEIGGSGEGGGDTSHVDRIRIHGNGVVMHDLHTLTPEEVRAQLKKLPAEDTKGIQAVILENTEMKMRPLRRKYETVIRTMLGTYSRDNQVITIYKTAKPETLFHEVGHHVEWQKSSELIHGTRAFVNSVVAENERAAVAYADKYTPKAKP
jgi:hypothetical protein